MTAQDKKDWNEYTQIKQPHKQTNRKPGKENHAARFLLRMAIRDLIARKP